MSDLIRECIKEIEIFGRPRHENMRRLIAELERLQLRNAELESHLGAYKAIPTKALRQYKRNDNSGFVFAYDKGYVDGILTKYPTEDE